MENGERLVGCVCIVDEIVEYFVLRTCLLGRGRWVHPREMVGLSITGGKLRCMNGGSIFVFSFDCACILLYIRSVWMAFGAIVQTSISHLSHFIRACNNIAYVLSFPQHLQRGLRLQLYG